jgi:7tm Odorant receptor
MWLPTNGKENNIVFWVSASYQTMNTTCLSGVDIVLDVLPVFFMSFSLELLEELENQLSNLSLQDVNGENKIKEEKFLKCIQLHSRILDISKKIEDVFATALLMRGLMSTLIFCTTAFALTIVS